MVNKCFQQDLLPKYRYPSSVCPIPISENWKSVLIFLNYKFLYTSAFILNFYNFSIGMVGFQITSNVTIWIRAWLMLLILLRYLWYLRNMASWLHKFHTRRSTVCIKKALQQKMSPFFSSNCIFLFSRQQWHDGDT